jgi:hypothetical protein
MKQCILFCLVAISAAANVTNKTLSTNNNLVVDDDDESFYTVGVLLEAGGVFTPKIG